ncbi:TPA: fimbrial protein [Serratia fonticola]|nr:fimbrial protein [Serratia fonticola]
MYYRVVLIFCLLLGVGRTPAAQDYNISLHGELVEEPCTLSMASINQTVKLGNVVKNTLYLHQRTHSYGFSIALEDCDISMGNSVEIGFNGVEDLQQPGLLAVNGIAKGIAIGLETEKGKPLEINKTIKSYLLHDGTRTLNFSAYVSASEAAIEHQGVVEGDFTANVAFTLYYP